MGTSFTLRQLHDRHGERIAPPRPKPTPTAPPVAGTMPALLLEVCRTKFSGSFTVEQLTIAAWLACPDQFGLRGYSRHYPDNNKVISLLSGKRGLVARGYLDRLPGGLLQVVRP